MGSIFANEMELDSKTIKRLFKILKYRFIKNRSIILKKVISYLYLFISYAAIVYNFSYYIRIMAKPIGSLLLSMQTIGYCITYVIINHLVIKIVVSNRVLLLIEWLLFVTLCVLWWSDIKYENRHM